MKDSLIVKLLSNKKLLVFLLLAAAILIMNYMFGWSGYLAKEGGMNMVQELAAENLFLAAILYVVLTITGCVVLALPGVTFAIVAGLIFGPVLGTFLCSVASTSGAALAFLAGRFFLKDSIKPMVMKNRYLKKLLFDEAGKNDIVILMITRLVPVFPYNLQNFAYGITDIRFWPYLVYSFLFMIPGTALFTVGTAGFTAKENRTLYIGAAVLLAVFVCLAGYILKKRYIKEEQEKG